MNVEERLEPALGRLSHWSLIITIAISVLSLTGWASGLTILKSIKLDYIPIAPSTILCFLILSFPFLIYIVTPNTFSRTMTAFCAFFTVLIALILLISFFMGIIIEAEHLGFTQIPFQTTYRTGHMSPVTAIMFIVASSGILLLCLPTREKQLYKNAASFMELSVSGTGLIMIVGYLYGTPLLYGGTLIPVAFQTALAFVFLGFGIILALDSYTQPIRLFAGSSIRSLLMRKFLPTLVGVVLLSSVINAIALSSAINLTLTLSLIAIASAFVVVIIITKMAKSVGWEIDQANRERDEKVIELQESEDKFRTIFDRASDGMLIADTITKKFLMGNTAICSMLGYTKEEIESLAVYDIHPPKDISHVLDEFEKLAKGEKILAEDLPVLRKDGSIFYANIGASPTIIVGAPCLLGIFRDITERKRVEEQIHRQSKLLAAINTVFFTTLSADSEETVANSCLKVAQEITDSKFGFIGEITPEGLFTTTALSDPGWEACRIPETQANVLIKDMVIRGIWGQVILKERSLIINNPVSYPDRVGIPEGHPSLSSFLGVPLKDQGKVIGMIAMANRVSGYTADDQQDMETLSVAFVEALRRKQAEEKLQQTLESLRRALNTTIQVMVSVGETRDLYTAGHQVRSGNLARAIATEMGLSPEKIEGIRMVASIHDIGKLSIPAEILSKPSKLTNIEFSLIKEHARRGYEILKDVESPWPLAEIVYQHHERMDGSGYPRNLKGDDILIEARILTVADLVEAMASHRPYRPSLGIDAALDEIEKNRGILYDSEVADACLRLFREKGFKFASIS